MEIVITNNPLVREKFSVKDDILLEFHDTDYLSILKTARDKIHLGHSLLTHPLSGSIKPGETPYKTLIISAERGKLDEKALFIIEESIQACQKFAVKNVLQNDENNSLNKKVLKDYQLIDYDLVFTD